MAEQLCDICGIRPAEVWVTLTENGQTRTLSVCAVDIAKLQQRFGSPLELRECFRGAYF